MSRSAGAPARSRARSRARSGARSAALIGARIAALLAVLTAPVALGGPIGIAGALSTPAAPAPQLRGVVAAPRAAGPAPRFLALGDLPYASAEEGQLRWLLRQGATDGAPFVIHVGDIKDGSAPCTDAAFAGVATLFRDAPLPIAFTPGDNEWTDCRRGSAGGYDPLERLAVLRRLFFADDAVLRRARLGAVVPDPRFPENAYFAHQGVMFALIHVVGSENNHRPRDPRAMAEFDARSDANRALLERAADAARLLGVSAVVVVFHANPLFERTPPLPGFASLFKDLEQLLAVYPGPVLAIHGDTHGFRFDQPLRKANDADGGRFWRLEVPGSPITGAVWVQVTTDPQRPFLIDLLYPSMLVD